MCFASANNFNRLKNSTDSAITSTTMKTYNLCPMSSLTNYSAANPNAVAAPNGDVITSLWSSNADGATWCSVELWYMDIDEAKVKGTPSYGKWHCTYTLSGNHTSPPIVTATANIVVAIMHSANILVGMKSIDWGRTWGQHSSLRTAPLLGPAKYASNWNPGYGNGYHYFLPQARRSDDQYIRFICTHISGVEGTNIKIGSTSFYYYGQFYGCAASSTTHIMKLDASSMTITVDICSSEGGSGTAYIPTVVGLGENYGTKYVWMYPVGAGNWTSAKGTNIGIKPGGMSGNAGGDARYLHWFDDYNDTAGYAKFDDSFGYMWMSHIGGSVKFDSQHNLWAAGAGYYGSPEGAGAYLGQNCNPDIMQGDSYDPAVAVWTEINADVITSTGGVGAAFEILEV
jgi:hypothetical protein